tara:strand:+ start:1326 stop:1574 length:249 start_codon:yes stop_codon:yes gene_type:complete
MNKNTKNQKVTYFLNGKVDLPNFVNPSREDCEINSTEGTNVIRVPFGIRLSKRKRPEKNQRIATLVLPITSCGTPTPPPFVA